MLGMNDGEYQPYDAAIFNKFVSGYCHILDRLGAELPKARITLLEPSAYDDVTRPPGFPGGYNSVLLNFGKYLRKLAEVEESAGRRSGNAPVVSAASRREGVPPGRRRHKRLIPDRVHPSPGVHMIGSPRLCSSRGMPLRSLPKLRLIPRGGWSPARRTLRSKSSIPARAFHGRKPTAPCPCLSIRPTRPSHWRSAIPISRRR